MLTIVAAALSLFTAPLVAQQAAPAAAMASGVAEEKPICRRIQVTGSNFTKRECHTRAEWKSIHERDEANASNALDNRAPRNPKGE